MPTSGSGTGHPTAPIPGGLEPYFNPWCEQAVKLWRYAQIIGYQECAFFGIAHPDNPNFACREIWTKEQRDEIAKYLCQAQANIEEIVGFPLNPKYIVDEESPYKYPLKVDNFHVISAGTRAETTLASDFPVSHATDPAVIGPLATTVTNVSEFHLFYPGTDQEIFPRSTYLAGGQVTFNVSRCRLVDSSLLDNPETGLDYYDLNNFADAVDIKRIYTDFSIQATLVYPHYHPTGFCTPSCSEGIESACVYVKDKELGILDILPATYSNGVWTPSSCDWRGAPTRVRVNYLAGLSVLTYTMEDAIIRLAHSLMPTEPCGCAITQRLWSRDRNVPDVLTRERIENPFGLSDGAWTAWKFSESAKMWSISIS